MILKKSWFVFVAILLLAVAAGIAAILLLTAIYLRLIVLISTVWLLFWWCLYYYKLEYAACDNTISINSGVVFHRKRLLKSDNILWIGKVKPVFCRDAILTFLHTTCGTLIILGEYSTGC